MLVLRLAKQCGLKLPAKALVENLSLDNLRAYEIATPSAKQPIDVSQQPTKTQRRPGPFGPGLLVASFQQSLRELDTDYAHAHQHQSQDAQGGHSADANLLAAGDRVAAILAGLRVHEEAGDVANAGQ